MAFECARVAFGARVEHPEGGDGGLGARGAATSGRGMSLGSPNGPRGIHAALVDASAMGTRARIANRARGSARGATPFFAQCPAHGPRWRTKRSGAVGVRAGRAPMSTPSGILKRISASLIASYSSSCCPILPSLRRLVRLLSPAPRTPVREIRDGSAFGSRAGARLRYPRSGDAIRARGCITRRTTRRACDRASLDAPRAKASERGPVG